MSYSTTYIHRVNQMIGTLALLGIRLMVLVSPGSDFTMIVKNSLCHSRQSGVMSALGIATGNLFHICYILLGFGFFILEHNWIFSTIKFLGASYLIYLGLKGLLASKSNHIVGTNNKECQYPTSSIFKDFLSGFLNSALNPKTILFYVSVFSTVVTKDTTPIQLVNWSFLIFLEVFAWFSFVSVCFSNSIIRNKFVSVGHWIERITGTIMIALGIKLFFVKINR